MAPLRGNPAFLSNVARDVLAEVQQKQREGRLGFLVGAGLSTAIGLPGWHGFNTALVEQTFDRHTPGGAGGRAELARAYLEILGGQPLAAVDFVRRRAGSDFHVVLKGALYEHKAVERFEPTEVHYALCKLASEGTPPWPVVHTTNYDDLLEMALRVVEGKQVQSVHAASRAAHDGPRVVHLHGYFPHADLPAAQRARLARTVVASDLDYSRLSNDHSAFTNRELLQLLDARSVLIVGMSLTDPNVRRLFAYLSDRPYGGPQHYVVLLHRQEGGEAARLIDEDEHEFWKARGVKILRLQSWDRLNYLLRRIRFSDDKWDRRHRDLRIAWASRQYGKVAFEDEKLQGLGTEALKHARDQLGLDGRIELNLFLPLHDGSYKRVFSSMPGRALEAPRPFSPAHDRQLIPEVETALALGQPILRSKIKSAPPLPGQPPFQTWYKSLLSVPCFDESGGGIPVAVLQVCADDPAMPDRLEPRDLSRIPRYLREVVRGVCGLLREARSGRKLKA